MATHSRAGLRAEQKDLPNIPVLVSNYFLLEPDPLNPSHSVVLRQGTEVLQTRARSINITFGRLLKPLRKFVKKKVLMGRCSWGKIRMRFQNPHLLVSLKF